MLVNRTYVHLLSISIPTKWKAVHRIYNKIGIYARVYINGQLVRVISDPMTKYRDIYI